MVASFPASASGNHWISRVMEDTSETTHVFSASAVIDNSTEAFVRSFIPGVYTGLRFPRSSNTPSPDVDHWNEIQYSTAPES